MVQVQKNQQYQPEFRDSSGIGSASASNRRILLLIVPAIFGVGLITGMFYEDIMLKVSTSATGGSNAANAVKKAETTMDEENGWTSVNVFYGDASAHAKAFDGNNHFSQCRQDEIVMGLFRNKRDGYFLDLAANGVNFLSNTFALERDYNWKGMCIEPNALFWYGNAHMRPRCTHVAAVVGGERDVKVDFHYVGGGKSGIVGNQFDNKPDTTDKATIKTEFTVPLLEVFQRHNTPKVIDYFSLDVEGAEDMILMNFPIEEYTFKVLTIERPRPALQEYLKKHGYEMIVPKQCSIGESLFIHKSARPELDISSLDKYRFPVGMVTHELGKKD